MQKTKAISKVTVRLASNRIVVPEGSYIKKKLLRSETQRMNTTLVCGFDGCDKEFAKKCNMLDHLRTHSGVKPYSCKQCGKAFKQRAQLYKHFTIHGEFVRLSCGNCQKVFSLEEDLKVRPPGT